MEGCLSQEFLAGPTLAVRELGSRASHESDGIEIPTFWDKWQPGEMMNQSQILELLGVTCKTIQRWQSLEELRILFRKTATRVEFDPPVVITWFFQFRHIQALEARLAGRKVTNRFRPYINHTHN